MTNQIKNKGRVADHGEVFTASREVNAMLDLVEHETLRIDSRFLEPACGDGNFLAPVLERKLEVVKQRYGRVQFDFERNAIIAISSVYGVDILSDNVEECRSRLFGIFEVCYRECFADKIKPECLRSAQVILGKNILWGDALSLLKSDGSGAPIVFTEWTAVNGRKIKRREYTLANLLAYQPMEEANLFSDLGDEAFIPKPIKDYPLIDFLEIVD
ncbi:SAM-dependent DNA methyltransferase [Sulfitobacter sp. HGT1]|uniref:SAM-dependent DNA methyltransferase n=1 Tax=Sulfitobacter sp. HGT1 TaxID=2735435 RepID=UPI001593246C|nr:SAM-dependent DNA methyltransferase [Sulfitobacter sp. HGT1]